MTPHTVVWCRIVRTTPSGVKLQSCEECRRGSLNVVVRRLFREAERHFPLGAAAWLRQIRVTRVANLLATRIGAGYASGAW
jgi:hypothetical protein